MRTPGHFILILIACLAALAPARAASAAVSVEIEQFGVGGEYRPDSMTAVRVKLTNDDPTSGPISVWVHWEVPNADGDIAEYGRAVNLSGTGGKSLWLYAPLPPDTDPATAWAIRVYLTDAGGRRGEDLGSLRFSPSGLGVRPYQGLYATVGSSTLGLQQYKLQQLGSAGAIFTGHEDTVLAAGLRASDIPDRWEGLDQFAVIAWGPDLSPQDLGAPAAEAILEWVRRGGHFVIVPPTDANPWGFGEPNRDDFSRLLPPRPRRVDIKSVRTLAPLLSKSDRFEDEVDFPVTINAFDDLASPWIPLVRTESGDNVVIQRSFGHGRITLIGINIAEPRFRSIPFPNGVRGAVPQADRFWNPILGRRNDTPYGRELVDIQTEDWLSPGSPTEVVIGSGELVRPLISHSGQASIGLGLAFFLFFVYWAVAGPGGFAVLKMTKRVQHAWVAFAAAAACFTAIAWGGVQLLRENKASVRHVTFLDYVARPGETQLDEVDPNLHRASSWMSVYVPGYSDTAIGIASLPSTDGAPAQRDLLTTYSAVEKPQKFPNAARYKVDLDKNPDDFEVPSRSTATQLQARWLGEAGSAWGTLLRSSPDDPLKVRVDRQGNQQNERLVGSIVSELPATLEDITVFWIRSKAGPVPRYQPNGELMLTRVPLGSSGAIRVSGAMIGIPSLEPGAVWKADQETIAAGAGGAFTGKFNLSQNLTSQYKDEFRQDAWSQINVYDRTDRRKFMEMLTIYGQLEPPDYLRAPGTTAQPTVVAIRRMGRELDLSPWFARPCVIVIGYVENSACPIPLLVDEKPVTSDGLTVVRWIYPLDVEEDLAFPKANDIDDIDDIDDADNADDADVPFELKSESESTAP